MQDSRWGLLRADQRGRIPSFDLLATLFLMQPRNGWPSVLRANIGGSCPAFHPPVPLSPSWGCSQPLHPPACIDSGACPDPMQGLAFGLVELNVMRFAQAHLYSLSRFLWVASHPSGVSAAPLSLVSSANLLRVHSISLSMSLMKIWNSTSPSTDP